MKIALRIAAVLLLHTAGHTAGALAWKEEIIMRLIKKSDGCP
jgi:hypothetical protein